MRRSILATALVALVLASIPHETSATRRRGNGRGFGSNQSSTPATPLPFEFSPITELFDGLDRNSGGSYRTYRHQPTITRAPISGDLLVSMRAAAGHSGADDAITVIRSPDEGLSWSDRRTEVTFSNDALWQEVASISTVGSRVWLAGSDVDVIAPLTAPTRTCWTAYSDDDGVTWSAKSFNVPVSGTNFTTCGNNTGIYEAANGDLVLPGYANDIAQTAYNMHLYRSTDNGVTWVVGATIAASAPNQYEEAGCVRVASTHTCLLRVDNTGGVDPNRGIIYSTRSTDDGVTWSAPLFAFNGRGTPALVRLTNGTMVATNRSRGTSVIGPDEGFRGQIFWSRDEGLTWEGGTEFMWPIAGLPAEGLRGGGYMGAGLIETTTPNVVGVIWSQDSVAPVNTQATLDWRTLAFDGAAAPTYDRSEYALRMPDAGAAYLDYGANDLLNGSTAWTMSFYLRRIYTPSGSTWAGTDEHIIGRRVASTQFHVSVLLQASRRIQVWIGNTLTSAAFWTSPTNVAELDNGQRIVVTVRFDGGGATNADRLRVWFNGREATTDGVFSGAAIPTVMTSPTTAPWQIAASNGASTMRSTVIDNVAIWPTLAFDPADIGYLWANGIPGRVDLSPLGMPAVWLRFENDTTNSGSDGTWGTPTVTGSPFYVRRVYSSRNSTTTAAIVTDGVWANVGRMTPAADPDPGAFAGWSVSEGALSEFDESRTQYGFDGVITNTNPTTSLIRLDHTHTFAAAGVTLGMDVGDPASHLFDIQDGFQWQGSLANLSSGIPAGTSGGLIFNRGLSGFPFTDPVLQNSTLLFGAITDTTPTASDDIVCASVSAAGARTTVTIDAMRTDDRIDVDVYAPPGGAYVRATFRNAVTGVSRSCTLTTNLPTDPLGFITHATTLASGGPINMVVGPAAWGRGVGAGVDIPRMPQAFTGATREAWMEDIEPSDLREVVYEMLEAPVGPHNFGIGADGLGGIEGRYGSSIMLPTGLPYLSLAPSTANGTDGTYGDYLQLNGGAAEAQPAGLYMIPPAVFGDEGRAITRQRGFFVDVMTQRTDGSEVTGTRSLLAALVSGDFDDPTSTNATFPGIGYEHNVGDDATTTGYFSHNGAATGGTTRTDLRALGAVRADAAVYRVFLVGERDGTRIGRILYRYDTNQLIESAWISANIPAIGDTMFPATTASACDLVSACTAQTHRLFHFRGHTRDPRSNPN
jgi:hypothetical protein